MARHRQGRVTCLKKPGHAGRPSRGTETVTGGSVGERAGVGSAPPQEDGRSGERRRRRRAQGEEAGAQGRGGTGGARVLLGATAETVRRISKSGARCARVCGLSFHFLPYCGGGDRVRVATHGWELGAT